MRYAGTDWSYAEPEMIRMEIDEWSVLICGHKLGPLFVAIEDHTLARVRAHPEWEHDRDHEPDTFVTSIRFVRQSALNTPGKQNRASQLNLVFKTANGAVGPEVRE